MRPSSRQGRAVAAALLLAATACGLAARGRPQSSPGTAQGSTLYTVGRLSFEAPAAWEASGDARHVLLVSPERDARVEAAEVARAFPDDASCMAAADEALRRGRARLVNVRRHTSSLAGRRAIFQEADQERWHGWAWVLCDGGQQYRLFVSGVAPVREGIVRAMQRASSSAALAPR